MLCDPVKMENVQVGINVFPTKPPPPPPPPPGIPAKLLAIMKKYKYNWRLAQLAKAKPPVTPKFVTEIVGPRYGRVEFPPLTSETAYYADHMSRPLVRTLVINKGLFGKQNGVKYRRKMTHRIQKSWASIYNFYRLRERERKLRRLRMELPKEPKAKKKPKVFKRTELLSIPKKMFFPEKKGQKKKKIFAAFRRLELLASPVSRPEPPTPRKGVRKREIKGSSRISGQSCPRKQMKLTLYASVEKSDKPKKYRTHSTKDLILDNVSPAALKCVPSELTIKLSQLPERWSNLPKPLIPGQVKKGALKYKISPRIAALAVPRPRSEKAKTDENDGPWTISRSALTYKATPRIIELAKPIDRD